ncbi:MAG: PAS domain S-box protein [Bacteroidales bacterium]|nr:PAS domain S-box protein [Bacteroidales bacterium]
MSILAITPVISLNGIDKRRKNQSQKKPGSSGIEAEFPSLEGFKLLREGVIAADSNGMICYANESAESQFRKVGSELCGSSIHSILIIENGHKAVKSPYSSRLSLSHSSFIYSGEGKCIGELFFIRSAIKSIKTDNQDISIHETFNGEIITHLQYNIANAMVSANSLHGLFSCVKEELSLLLDTTNFIIALYDPSSGLITAPFEVDENNDLLPSWPAEKSLTGLVIKKRRTLLLNRKQIADLADKGEIKYMGTRAECWLGVPLLYGEKSLGAIVVQSYSNPEEYDNGSIEILQIIANQLSIYIEKKRSDEASEKLSKAMVHSPLSVVITDYSGTIEYVNPKFCEITGYTAEEAIGNNPRILKSGQQESAFYASLWESILQGKEWKGEMHNRKKNGDLYWENVSISPIINSEGEISHFVAVKEDITDKKKMHDDLVAAKNQAEESDRLKTAFLQNISHEIRTPLNGMLGFAYIINNEVLSTEKVKEYSAIIHSSGKRLLELINNIIDISKIESGTLEVNLTDIHLHTLIQGVLNQFIPVADSKNIRMVSPIEYAGDDIIIRCDELKLHQVLTNLVDNSLKFTLAGTIEIGYILGKNEIVFSVNDTGVGIPVLQQSRIFERFYQADMSISRGFEGSGLGLSICKGLVDLLKGKIWLESKEEKGTTVFFSIPVDVITRKNEPVQEHASSSNKFGYARILVAEDDDFSFTLLETILEQASIGIIRAFNGKEAVKYCEENNDIDLILMDLKMPEMNGIEATRRIKELRPELPIIAQTAYAFSNERAAAIEAGCDEYITKPISVDKLNEMLQRWSVKQNLQANK